jgi:hypothetical protein
MFIVLNSILSYNLSMLLTIILSLVLWIPLSLSAQNIEPDSPIQTEEENVLKSELSDEEVSHKEFKDLVQNTIILMGPDHNISTNETDQDSSATVKN